MNTKTTTNLHFAAVLALSLLPVTAAWAVERQSLSGHVPSTAARLQPVGRLPGSSRLNLAIGLPLRNQEGLTTLLEQLSDPASPQYRHYLTPEQFAEKFGPAKADYEALTVFAKAHGLQVTGTHPNRTLLDVSGSVADIERAFHLTMREYQHPIEPRTFHAPDTEPSLDLALPILRISGLDDFSRPRPASLSGSGPGGGFIGNDFRAAYAPGVALTGAGQTVALFEFDGYYPSDITDYETLTTLPNVPLQNVLMGGFDGTPGPNNFEVALDIEMVISMAPGLTKLIVYEAPDDSAYTMDVLNRIATDNLARQISCSWSLGQHNPAADQIFMQMAAQGQSFFNAAGDFGAFTSFTGIDGDSPYITFVGGTTLTTSGPSGGWASETVWNQGYLWNLGYCVGSGGGISPTYPIPSWQQGLSMVANRGSTSRRNYPDVAMVADNIWVLADNGNSSARSGTSAAAPLWAGFAALANQLAKAHGQPPIGFINPAIYALGKGASYNSVFHDITTGNNTTTGSPTRFSAVSGFDLCTGWGTPNGSNLLYALALPQFLQIAPGTNFTASGPPGGPFDAATQSFSLTNSGAAPFDWALGYTAPWLQASASRGTLAPGDPAATLILSPNAAANNLPVGSYSANAWFTNLNDGSVQTRLFTLDVVREPVILLGPIDLTVPEGATATFTVVAASSGLLSYSWTRDQIPLTDDSHITGSATATLTLNNVSSTDEGTYSAVVSNAFGSVTNRGSTLTVRPVTLPWVNLTTLYSFRNGNDGAYPNGLVQALDGNFYGTANSAGASGNGTVFRITTNGALTTLHSFTGGNDGANPRAALIQAENGNFYGTTYSGANYWGTVFRVTASGALTTLHAFAGSPNDGASPFAGLLQIADGSFYGTTSDGGTSSYGTVFKMIPNGALTLLHSFSQTDGAKPRFSLILDQDGELYGTTRNRGLDGTVFRITTAGTLTTLVHGTNNFSPRGGLVWGSDGNIYGTTGLDGAYRSGTVYRITPAGVLTTLHSFNGAGDGQQSLATLVEGKDGYFYGATLSGGSGFTGSDFNGQGTVFRISPRGTLTTLLFFDGFNGANPSGALVQAADGNFYGTTLNGGASGFGTVFRLTVPAPHLSIALSGSQIVLSWPSWASDLVLQQASDLAVSNWTVVTNAGVITNSEAHVILSPTPGNATFYRLTH